MARSVRHTPGAVPASAMRREYGKAGGQKSFKTFRSGHWHERWSGVVGSGGAGSVIAAASNLCAEGVDATTRLVSCAGVVDAVEQFTGF